MGHEARRNRQAIPFRAPRGAMMTPSNNLPIIGAPFAIEGFSTAAKLTCNCAAKESLEVPQGHVVRCPTCRRGFKNHGMQRGADGQLHCAIEVITPEANDATGGRGTLRWTPEFLLELMKGAGRPMRVEVVKDAVPADAVITRVSASDTYITIEIESAEFPASDTPTVLPPTQFRIVDSDAKIVHDAGLLRAALKESLALHSLSTNCALCGASDDGHDAGCRWARLLADTADYELPDFDLALKGAAHV